MPRTLNELCKEAIGIQGACNLSGVLHSFSRAITDLREVFPTEGTDFFNRHPVCVMFSDKIASLTNTQTGNCVCVSDAYAFCLRMSNEDKKSAVCPECRHDVADDSEYGGFCCDGCWQAANNRHTRSVYGENGVRLADADMGDGSSQDDGRDDPE